MKQIEYVLMIGVALSGKTTYRKANFNYEVVALSYFNNNRKKEFQYIEECLKEGRSIVVDDTNLTISLRKQHIDLAKKFNARVREIFMNTSAALLEQRQKRRRDSIPLSVIYKQIKELEVPTMEEGFEQIIVKKDYEQPRDT